MATTKNMEESSSEQVKIKTWVLKVSIHCEGCKKKVIKLLTGVEGVYKLDVDLKQQSVMVTGNVEADTLITKLIKSGRNAELWCQISNNKKSAGDEKKTVELPTSGEKEKKSEMGKSDAAALDGCKVGGENPAMAEGGVVVAAGGDITAGSGGEVVVKEEKLVGKKSEVGSESNPPPCAAATEGSNKSEKVDGEVSKKKKKKGHNGNCSNNNNKLLGEQKQKRQVESSSVDAGPQNNAVTLVRVKTMHPRQHLENQHVPPQPPPPQPVYVVSYNMASTAPSYTTSYYNNSPTSPQPPAHENRYHQVAPLSSDQGGYSRQPLDTFEIFSDENPNGCSIM